MLTTLRAIRDWAEERPDELAVLAPGRRQTIGELWDDARRIAGWLRSIGVPDDEPIGIAMPPDLEPEMLVAMLIRGGPAGVYTAGAEVGPGRPITRLVSTQALDGIDGDRWIRFDAETLRRMRDINPDEVEPTSPGPDDLGVFFYSSGTTGAPKAISRTMGRLDRRIQTPHVERGWIPGHYGTLLLGTSLNFLTTLLDALVRRQPFVVTTDIDRAVPLLAEAGVEVLFGAPAQHAALLAAARRRHERLPALRAIVSTGAPIAPALVADLAEWFGAEVHDYLGSTEIVSTISQRRLDGQGAEAPRGGSVGRETEVEIVDDEHRPVPAGTVGRLRMRSAVMSEGYLGDVDTGPHKGFHDGWFLSGDLARLVDGRLELVGRDDDVLNIGGQKILPSVVEEAFGRVPGVRDAVAVAVTDRLGQAQLAVALVGEGIEDPAGLARGLRRELDGIVPVLVATLPDLPRTRSGKPLRAEAAALLQARLDARETAGLAPVRALRAWAAERPEELAVVGPDFEWSTRRLWDTALRVVGWLRELGVPDDEPLAVAVTPPLEPMLFVAMLIRGGPTASYAGSAAAIGPEELLRRVVATKPIPGVPPEHQIILDNAARAALGGIDPASVEVATPAPGDVVRYTFSSGTTGAPKPIPRTAEQVELKATERPYAELADGPLAILMSSAATKSQSFFLRSLVARRTHPLIDRTTPERALALLRRQRVAMLAGSPLQLGELLSGTQPQPQDFPDLVTVVSFGAPLPESLAHGLATAFGVDVYDELGSNESGMICLRRIVGHDTERPDLVLPPGAVLEIVDDEHRILPDGEAGRLRVRVPGMSESYAADVDAGPHRGFHDGWFYSGDLARLVDGSLELLGRDDELLNIGGWKIMARQVEKSAEGQAGVTEAVAVAVADARGEPQLALAYLGAQLDEAILTSAIQARVGGKRPALALRLDELPRTATGKSNRREVAAILQERLALAAELDEVATTPSAEALPTGSAPTVASSGGAVLASVAALRDWAAERPDDLAVVGAGITMTAGELWSMALRVAGWLRGLGISDDEVVATSLPRDLEPAFLFGLLVRGGPSASYSAGTPVGPGELIQRVIAPGPVRGVPAEALVRFDAGALARLADVDPAAVQIAAPEPDALVRINFSSGSTGVPKAIPRTARQLDVRIGRNDKGGLVDGSRATLTQGGAGVGVNVLLSTISRRQPFVVIAEPSEALPVLREQRIEIIEGSPAQLASLLDAARARDERLPWLRTILSSGAPIAATLVRGLADWFGTRVYDGFGSAETGFIATRRVDDLADDAAEARGGEIVDGIEAEIVDDDHRPLPEGSVGRLRLRSPDMPSGYALPIDTGPHKGFHDGWFFTGDLARLVKGRLHLVGRDDDLLNIGGQKFLPQRIEELATRRVGIREAIAAAVVDAAGRQHLALALLGDPRDELDAIVAETRAVTGGISPVLVLRLPSLPLTPTGKPKRDEVAAILQRRFDARAAAIQPVELVETDSAVLGVVRALRDWAAERPGDLAVAGPGFRLTAGELWDDARRLAGWLRGLGIGPGEAVASAVPAPLQPVFHVALLLRGGAGAVYTKGAEIGADAPVQYVVAVEDVPGIDPERIIRLDADAIGRIDPDSVEAATYRPDELIRITYSSGTTGAPKAVLRDAGSVMDEYTPDWCDGKLDGPLGILLPLGSRWAQSNFEAALFGRLPVLLMNGPVEAVPLLAEYGTEILMGSPAQLMGMLARARELDARLPALRRMITGGAAMTTSQLAALTGWFNAELFEGLGATEVGFVAMRRLSHPPTSWYVVNGGVVEVVDDEHRPVSIGETGYVRERAPGQARGYWGNPDLGPHKGFHDGWFYPGDLARALDDGFELLGRDDDLINLGGVKFMPQRAEEVATRHSGVQEAIAAVVAEPSGRRRLALAVLGEPGDTAGLTEEIREAVGVAPVLLVRLPDFPRTDTGKAKRSAIAEILQARFTPVAEQVPTTAPPEPESTVSPTSGVAAVPTPITALAAWAAERPDDLAVVGPKIALSAGELWDNARRIAGWLRASGVGADEAVGAAVRAGLTPAFLIALLIRGGAGSITTGKVELGPDAALQRLVTTRIYDWLPPERQLPFDAAALQRAGEIDPDSVEPAAYRPDDPILLAFSSGTTGTPKAIVRTAGALERRVARPGRQELAGLASATLQPLTSAGAQTHFLAALTQRRPFLVIDNPARTVGLLRDHRIEVIAASPHQLDQLLTNARREGERLPALNRILSSGAPISPDLAASLTDWFGAEVHDQYGSTETGAVAGHRVNAAGGARGGELIEGTEVEIVDDDHVPLPLGEDGRIRIRTDGMATRYLGDAGLGPHQGFHEGWFFPGDIGRLEAGPDGLRLIVLGRQDEVMNVAGRKIIARDVEETVTQLPGIREALAGVVVDQLGVRQLALAIVGEPEDDPATLVGRIRARMEGIGPAVIVRMRALPRTESGKVKRDEVVAMLQRRIEAGSSSSLL